MRCLARENDSNFFARADKQESREDLNGFARFRCGDVASTFFFFEDLLMHALPALKIFKSLLAGCRQVSANINATRKAILLADYS